MTATNKNKVIRKNASIACLMAVIGGGACFTSIAVEIKPRSCLNAITEDGQIVIPCDRTDPLRITHNKTAKAAAVALGVDIDDVEFRGCPGAKYSASESMSTRAPKYVITYPSEKGVSEIGPFIHEIAHIHQFQATGGMRKLEKYSSKEVELAADFVAGLVFKNALTDIAPRDYETGLSLMGLYFESGMDKHGDPEQRLMAFSSGYRFKFTKDVPNIAAAALHFHENIYGEL